LLTLPQAEQIAYFLYRCARVAASPFPIQSVDPYRYPLNPYRERPIFRQ